MAKATVIPPREGEEEFLRTIERQLTFIVRKWTMNRDLQEDLLQEARIAALLAYRRHQGDGSMVGYAYNAAEWAVRAALRKTRTGGLTRVLPQEGANGETVRPEELVPDPANAFAAFLQEQDLRETLKNLSPLQAGVLFLRLVEGLTFPEIAVRMAISGDKPRSPQSVRETFLIAAKAVGYAP